MISRYLIHFLFLMDIYGPSFFWFKVSPSNFSSTGASESSSVRVLGQSLALFPVPAGNHCSCDASSHTLGTISSIRLLGSLTHADHQPIFVAVEIAVVLQSFFASSGDSAFIFFISTTLSKQQARP